MRTLAVTLLSMLLTGAVSAADQERVEATKWRADVKLGPCRRAQCRSSRGE